jgi:hypothetical protein
MSVNIYIWVMDSRGVGGGGERERERYCADVMYSCRSMDIVTSNIDFLNHITAVDKGSLIIDSVIMYALRRSLISQVYGE